MELQGSYFQYATFIIVIISISVQLIFWLRYYLKSVTPDSPVLSSDKPPVSVIICARNEEPNLREHLPSVLQQNYPDYEVIVVNDCSEDNTDMVLKDFMARFPHLRTSTIVKDSRFHHNKKLAQLIGIKAAKNEVLLFTDADCVPVSEDWVALMTSHLRGEKSIVLGYGGYEMEKGILNSYIRYDTMFIAMQYLGRALRGRPYMGVGRNLAYRKSLFLSGSGFSSHYHLASGDDDLFVNANASSTNVAVETNPGSHIRSVPAKSFNELLQQKKRHLSTAGLYKLRDKFMLIAEPFSRVLFYTSIITVLALNYLWQVALGLLIIRGVIMVVTLSKAGKRLGEKKIILPALFFDILAPFINTLFYLSALRNKGKKDRWR